MRLGHSGPSFWTAFILTAFDLKTSKVIIHKSYFRYVNKSGKGACFRRSATPHPKETRPQHTWGMNIYECLISL